jgi:hypothetical protein
MKKGEEHRKGCRTEGINKCLELEGEKNGYSEQSKRNGDKTSISVFSRGSFLQ